jgi:hypothetical protein
MLLTEEEAKTKWCPNARESGGDTATFWNKPRMLIAKLFGIDYAEQEATDRGCLCIASACMAWRWQRDFAYSAYDAGPPPGKGWEKTGHTIHEGETVEWALSTGKGRCGLAGVE